MKIILRWKYELITHRYFWLFQHRTKQTGSILYCISELQMNAIYTTSLMPCILRLDWKLECMTEKTVWFDSMQRKTQTPFSKANQWRPWFNLRRKYDNSKTWIITREEDSVTSSHIVQFHKKAELLHMEMKRRISKSDHWHVDKNCECLA